MTTLRVLRTAKVTLAKIFYLDEVAENASGAVTVTITRYDGTVVQTGSASGPDANSQYTFTFNGSDTLDELDVAWSGTFGGDLITLDQDLLQVVGGFFFGVAEARSVDPVFQGTSGLARYPTSEVAARRIEVEDEAEDICRQAFVPRYYQETLSTDRDRAVKLRWPMLRKVRALTVDGVSWDSTQLALLAPDPLGLLRIHRWPVGAYVTFGGTRQVGNVHVEYEHGWDRPPTALVRAGKLRWKSLMLTQRSPLPDRAERIATTELGVVTLAIPSADSTGIPEVDAAYAKYLSPRPGFG